MRNDRDNQDTKRRSTFAILFYINRTKIRKDGTCQLLCKVSIDAKYKTFRRISLWWWMGQLYNNTKWRYGYLYQPAISIG